MDKKTPRALLKLDIGGRKLTVERRRESSDNNETPLFGFFLPHLPNMAETVFGGQFNWGGLLQNSNGVAQ